MTTACAVRHSAEDLIAIFNQCFADSHRTVLVRGDSEPIYHTWRDDASAEVVFAHGYFSSALHEIAHWCIAGEARRKQDDYGYWYVPDGRSAEQQRQFELVEVKPQALEWLFSLAADYQFVFSADNLDGDVGDMAQFKDRIQAQVGRYLRRGLRRRARRFMDALADYYGTHQQLARLRTEWPSADGHPQ